MSRYYDRAGRRISLDEWSQEFEGERHIGDDRIGDARVSTVYLGLDHNFGDGPPLIFETMIFGGPHDEFCERYSTEADAIAGHDRVVAALQEGRNP